MKSLGCPSAENRWKKWPCRNIAEIRHCREGTKTSFERAIQYSASQAEQRYFNSRLAALPKRIEATTTGGAITF
jgi:hypothetical protein